MMAMTLGVTPAVAPIFGGWFFSRFGWQSNFLVMAVLGLLLGLCVLLLLAESNQRRDPAATRIRPMLRNFATLELGRAHVCTPVTNAHRVCRHLLEKKSTELVANRW